jgi:beta-lactamase regulating signal transducer with metallopeptidase domain
MTLYLLETTLVLGVALAAARLPRLAARTRYLILFAALLKCAFPSSLLQRVPVAAHSGTILISGSAGRVLAAPAATRALWPELLFALWLAGAFLLLVRLLLLTRRTTREALAHTTHPSQRELAALAVAKQRTELTRDISLVRSPFAAAPAVLGLVHPHIVLPADSCDALDEDELASILSHECAHVARHDNLLALVEALIGSVLWFHPLVWLTRRALMQTREASCDERALAATAPLTYLHALTKLARGAVALPVPTVSCMAAANLQERMSDIMRFPSIRPLPHRLVASLAVISILAFTLTAGALRAADDAKPVKKAPYTLQLSVTPPGERHVLIEAVVLDDKGAVLMHPRVQTQRGIDASMSNDNLILVLKWSGDDVTGTLRSRKDGAFLTSETYHPPSPAHRGEGINLNLRDAEIRDVAKTFSQLTGQQIVVDDGVEGKVSIEVTDMPWEQALELCVKGAGLQMERHGSSEIRISR